MSGRIVVFTEGMARTLKGSTRVINIFYYGFYNKVCKKLEDAEESLVRISTAYLMVNKNKNPFASAVFAKDEKVKKEFIRLNETLKEALEIVSEYKDKYNNFANRATSMLKNKFMADNQNYIREDDNELQKKLDMIGAASKRENYATFEKIIKSLDNLNNIVIYSIKNQHQWADYPKIVNAFKQTRQDLARDSVSGSRKYLIILKRLLLEEFSRKGEIWTFDKTSAENLADAIETAAAKQRSLFSKILKGNISSEDFNPRRY